jgi:hypothetical protein
MITIYRKFLLASLIIALTVTALPLTNVFAAGSLDPTTPPAGTRTDPTVINARLELIFARQKMVVTRIGEAVANYDNLTKNVQTILDKAKARGKDVSAIQTAFDAFKAAFVAAKPLYEQANSLVTQHDGFDNNGKVIDSEKAKITVKNLREALKQYRGTIGETRQTLRNSIKAYRLANPHTKPTTTQP